MKVAKLIKIITPGLLVLGLVVTFSTSKVSALSGSEFRAGNIIENGVFFNSQSMSVQEIQNFLNAKVPTCDTWGTKWHSSGRTRAEHGAANGAPAPYTCLKSYSQNTPSKAAESGLCGSYAGGWKSSAQIIYDVAQICGINPQTLLVLLQKEQSLVTDDWPWPNQYRSATGYGCPDTAPCDSEYYGYFNQVYNAGRIYKKYARDAANYNYRAGRTNSILYNPSAACGRSDVYIDNQATAGLYIYTPYQPNRAALDNLYGSGDGCSAYGNRNFWRMWNDWFGSTYGDVTINSALKLTSSIAEGTFTNKEITLSFTISNSMASQQNLGTMMIAARDEQGNNFDFGVKAVTVGARQTYTYTASRTLPAEGRYTFWITNNRPSVGWDDNYPTSVSGLSRTVSDVTIQNMPTITSQPQAASELRENKTSNLTFTVKNNSKYPVDLGRIGLAVRDPDGANRDLPFEQTTIAANGSFTYSKPFLARKTGQHYTYISTTKNGGVSWNETTFPAESAGQNREARITSRASPTVTHSVTSSPTNPKIGQVTTLTYSVKNFSDQPVNAGLLGLAVRDPDGVNRDPRWDSVTIQPNTTFTYSVDMVFNKTGNWKMAIEGYRNNVWSAGWLPVEENGINRNITVNVRSNPTITEGITLTPATPHVGQPVTVRYRIMNDGDSPVTLGSTGVAIRDGKGLNRDPGWDSPTINAHTTWVYEKTLTFTNAGSASIEAMGYRDGAWRSDMVPSEHGDIVRRKVVNVLSGATVTQGITFTGQKTVGTRQLSFVVTNFTNSPIDLGRMGIAVRDPQGRNYDKFWETFVVPANGQKTHTVNIPFDKTGKWALEIITNKGSDWMDYSPDSESSSIVRYSEVDIQ